MLFSVHALSLSSCLEARISAPLRVCAEKPRSWASPARLWLRLFETRGRQLYAPGECACSDAFARSVCPHGGRLAFVVGAVSRRAWAALLHKVTRVGACSWYAICKYTFVPLNATTTSLRHVEVYVVDTCGCTESLVSCDTSGGVAGPIFDVASRSHQHA